MTSARATVFLKRLAFHRLRRINEYRPVDLPSHWWITETQQVHAQNPRGTRLFTAPSSWRLPLGFTIKVLISKMSYTQAVWAVHCSRRATHVLIDQLCCYENRRQPILFDLPLLRWSDSKVHFVCRIIYIHDNKFPQCNGMNETFFLRYLATQIKPSFFVFNHLTHMHVKFLETVMRMIHFPL